MPDPISNILPGMFAPVYSSFSQYFPQIEASKMHVVSIGSVVPVQHSEISLKWMMVLEVNDCHLECC